MKFLFPLCIVAILAGIAVLPTDAADDYVPGPDSKEQLGVPKGVVSKYSFEQSKIFPGTYRDYWVYVPAQYDPAKPACVYICQDGIQYGAPVVFDNLIHKGEMPVTIGVFVMHGRVKALSTNSLDRFNRSYEYDGLGDNYARFILEELLPDVAKRKTVDGKLLNLSTNGNDRCIAGASSGAICAFTAAWERPESFRRVFSTIGTYVDQRGGNDYPFLIRKTEPRALRVFLQDGSNDNNGVGGNWWIANQSMLSAFEFAGYEVNHIWGDGGHNDKQARLIFPDAMRWIWKGWPAEVQADPENKSHQPVMEILIPGEGWRLVSQGHRFAAGAAANAKGEVYFTDYPNGQIHKIGRERNVSVFAQNTGGAHGLIYGKDGNLYACANGKKMITSYSDSGEEKELILDVQSNDLVGALDGGYWTDPENKKVWWVNGQGEKQVVDTGIRYPNGVVTSPDQSLLYVSDTYGQFVYSFQIQPDGQLSHKQAFFHLRLPDGSTESGADGMTCDTQGRLYVATALGLQICDQAGRVIAIIPKPQRTWLSNVCFGGANFDELFVTCGDKVFVRKTKAKGALTFEPPIKPPTPRL